ncbi:hypothetical protein HMPREF1550_02577 [Actinomyces sp. oral taxon 877 str. F0543]|nr:hypothetical protein HMPREF1550_02577 [Actinomyces sp. oral taxon 877 str. F0543]
MAPSSAADWEAGGFAALFELFELLELEEQAASVPARAIAAAAAPIRARERFMGGFS